MVGLEALPLPAREEVVLCLPPADALKALPFVSESTLAALKELSLPIGKLKTRKVDEALSQAHALRRAWELGTLNFSNSKVRDLRDLSALAGCAKLHTLNFVHCHQLDVVSELASCATLHTLGFAFCSLTDVSALGDCAGLHTLTLFNCHWLTDLSGLANCAKLHTLVLFSRSVQDVSALADCAALHTLDLRGCVRLWSTGISALAGCAALHTLDLRGAVIRSTLVSALQNRIANVLV